MHSCWAFPFALAGLFLLRLVIFSSLLLTFRTEIGILPTFVLGNVHTNFDVLYVFLVSS